ncbi:hypothetical protein LMG28688_00088 [Paraburkholderia caffeinitolerans]|uniref:Uncharacterized protein n=1 Tax=Paraburkholderia caffeinitolerans TaxID=1723730 RepID=A0A6J5F9N4_9BURK|nr:hypothetical protein LMG28688_00088 [Paraburkholderia caffeinitolerans]
MVAWTPPYSVVFSFTTPDMQMVVVPAMSTRATTEMAKVSFTVLPKGKAAKRLVRGPETQQQGPFGAVPGSG